MDMGRYGVDMRGIWEDVEGYGVDIGGYGGILEDMEWRLRDIEEYGKYFGMYAH